MDAGSGSGRTGGIILDLFDDGLPYELGGPVVGEEGIADVTKQSGFRRCAVGPVLDKAKTAPVAILTFCQRNPLREQSRGMAI
ncbi:hypothetical protein [Rhizobium sp. BK456]|uniref:hypothetical protein n=1 Tax=Rhizobium sp. BK456 TaxID=2587007 RepID=UPI001621B03A|nr:hypothetical protein [Rhizobium sp. BK456]MBB3523100.1 hypothetical protein [Rhizobium sp. BK456]